MVDGLHQYKKLAQRQEGYMPVDSKPDGCFKKQHSAAVITCCMLLRQFAMPSLICRSEVQILFPLIPG